MQELNQQMFTLVKMIPRVIIKKVATFPPFTGTDLDRYTAALDILELDCETYLALLSNDEATTAPSDVFDLRNLIRNMQQSFFFDFLNTLEEVRDYVAGKVVPLPEPPIADVSEIETETEQPQEERLEDDQGTNSEGEETE